MSISDCPVNKYSVRSEFAIAVNNEVPIFLLAAGMDSNARTAYVFGLVVTFPNRDNVLSISMSMLVSVPPTGGSPL